MAIDEAIGLTARGIPVTYFSSIGPVCDELATAQVPVVLLGHKRLLDGRRDPRTVIQSLWNPIAYRAMDELLRPMDSRATIVHVHDFSQMSGSPIRCALNRGFKVVSTLHDYLTVCPNGGFFDYPTERPCERRPLSLDCVKRNCDKRNYLNKLYRVVKMQAQHHLGTMPSGVKHYIVVSQSSLSRLRASLPHDAMFFFLRNPCTVEKSPPVATRSHDVVAVIGRLSPEKGIALLVEAAKRTSTRLLFIGDGPLRHIAEAAGTHRVTGWTSRDGVLRLLNGVRCLAFPSLIPETYGLSVMDAAAKGVPAIVSDVSGIAEWIEHGKTGWRIPAGDISALAASLEAAKDDDVITNIGTAAYAKYWREPLSVDTHIRCLLDIYHRVLN